MLVRSLIALVASSVLAFGQEPEWVRSPGGTWYAATAPGSWDAARQQAESWGGHLATLTEPSESLFVLGAFPSLEGRYLGLHQDSASPTFAEPAGGWTWVTEETFGLSNWAFGQPDDAGGAEHVAVITLFGWSDVDELLVLPGVAEVGTEDCDLSGVPDLYEIATGVLLDEDENGVPDVCEVTCDVLVAGTIEIGEDTGGFSAPLDSGDFGRSVTALGDVNGDGWDDLAVGEPGTPGLGLEGVWVLFMGPEGVLDQVRIDMPPQTPNDPMQLNDYGLALAPLDDLDGNGVPDLALGIPRTSFLFGSSEDHGAVSILFLGPDGLPIHDVLITDGEGGLSVPVPAGSFFGHALASLGDLDGDGVMDIAVGAPGFFPEQPPTIWVLFLNQDGTVKAHHKIKENSLGPGASIGVDFAMSLACLGDLDGDGAPELAVGDPSGSGTGETGFVWILFLQPDGTVKRSHLIDPGLGAFQGDLQAGDRFGISVSSVGDIDGDNITDLAVGANGDDTGGPAHGAVWLLLLDPAGNVHAHCKLDDFTPGFAGTLEDFDNFGIALAALGTEDTGVANLAVGARSGGVDGDGAVHILELASPGWQDTGFGLAGSVGIPQLTGTGSLVVGESVQLDLTNVPMQLPAFLIYSSFAWEAPFKGGVMVPAPDNVLPFNTFGGAITVGSHWPPGAPTGFVMSFQWWLPDPSGVAGWSASNAVSATAP